MNNVMNEEQITIIQNVRLPRSVVGIFVGVSQGASFGVALAIIYFSSRIATPSVAFLFEMIAVSLCFGSEEQGECIDHYAGDQRDRDSLLFSSLLSLMKYLAENENQLASIVVWNMGSLASLDKKTFPFALLGMSVGSLLLFINAWRINIISMRENEARSMGLNVNYSKAVLIGGATLATAGAVSISGNFGWIGLLIPHVARFIVGSDNTRLIPMSMILGASILMLIDLVARSVTGGEIPLGILTSLLGGPFFIYLLRKYKGAKKPVEGNLSTVSSLLEQIKAQGVYAIGAGKLSPEEIVQVNGQPVKMIYRNFVKYLLKR